MVPERNMFLSGTNYSRHTIWCSWCDGLNVDKAITRNIEAKDPWKEHVPFRDPFRWYYEWWLCRRSLRPNDVIQLGRLTPIETPTKMTSLKGTCSFQGCCCLTRLAVLSWCFYGRYGTPLTIAVGNSSTNCPWKEHVPFRGNLLVFPLLLWVSRRSTSMSHSSVPM